MKNWWNAASETVVVVDGKLQCGCVRLIGYGAYLPGCAPMELYGDVTHRQIATKSFQATRLKVFFQPCSAFSSESEELQILPF